MNNKEFIAALSQRSGYTQTDTQRLVNSLIDEIVNPSSGVRMLVPPKLVLGFKPAASVKEQLKYGGGSDE